MKAYWLQTNETREMIDDRIHPGYESVKRVLASTWIHAKELLGYPLTALQAELRFKQLHPKG